MASPNTRKQSIYLGRGLVVLGFAAIVFSAASLFNPAADLLQKSKDGFQAVAPSLGLSLLHAATSLVIGQVDYFSLVPRILVLFSAMVAIIIGFTLVRPRSSRASASPLTRSSALDVMGDR